MLKTYLLAATREEFFYKTNFFGSIAAQLVYFALQYVFFIVISEHLAASAMPRPWLLHFFIAYSTCMLVVNFFSASIVVFFERLANGQADCDMIKPAGLLTIILMKHCRPTYLLMAMIVVIFAVTWVDGTSLPFKLADRIGFVLLCGLGIAANLSFIIILCAFTAITQRSLPVDFVHSELSALTMIPQSVYPANFAQVLCVILPMVMFASIATDALMGKSSATTILFAVASIAMIVLATFALKSLLGKFDSIGG